jgi:hypothetical protein
MKKPAPTSTKKTVVQTPKKQTSSLGWYEYCNTVTPFSKAIALILFVAFPFLGFVIGVLYQQALCALW